MPFHVLSKNITTVCSELGFSGQFPGREEKTLTAQTLNFPLDSLCQGTPFPFFSKDSPEAQRLAVQFCNESQRGQSLWPDTVPNSWPAWSCDRPKILRLVAHILSLHAYYKYQRRCKKQKKQIAGQSSPMESGTTFLFVGPSPPKGTRRRRAKKSDLTTKSSSTSTSTESMPDAHTLASYIEHVEWLDPKDHENPIREFTPTWLLRSSSEWPLSADRRVYIFMHKHHFYDPKHEECKELELISSLRHGTKIATGQSRQYIIFKERVMDRVSVLADELRAKHIIALHQNGKHDMVKGFKDIWQNRQDYWDKKGTSNPSVTQQSYDTLNLYDDEEGDCVPVVLKKKITSKAKHPITQPKTTTSTTRQRRKADDSVPQGRTLSSCFSPYPNKRQRVEPPNAVSPQDTVRRSTEISSDKRQRIELSKAVSSEDTICPSTESSNDDRVTVRETTIGASIDSETEEHIRFAEQVLASPTLTERLPTPPRKVTAPQPSRVERYHPMTPTSPIVGPGDIGSTNDQPFVKSPTTRTGTISSKAPSSPPHSLKRPTIRSETVSSKASPSPPYSLKSPTIRSETVSTKDPPSILHSFKSPTMRSETVSAKAQASKPPSFASNSSKASTIASTHQILPHLPSPTTTLQSSVPEISLILQKKNRTYDLGNNVPYSYFRVLDLAAFFTYFSQQSGTPFVELDCLTFKMVFGKHLPQHEVISKSSAEEEWVGLKAKIGKFFRFVRMERPKETKFDIWVEIGDTREEVEEDLGGF